MHLFTTYEDLMHFCRAIFVSCSPPVPPPPSIATRPNLQSYSYYSHPSHHS